MLNGEIADWWTGRTALRDVAVRPDWQLVPNNQARREGARNSQAFGAGHEGLVNQRSSVDRQLNELMPFNDGSAIAMGQVEKPQPVCWQNVRPQAGASKRVGDPRRFSQDTAWRLGEEKGVKIGDGNSPTYPRSSQVGTEAWRYGDRGHICLTDSPTDPTGTVSPPQHARAGGVGRRMDSTIQPFNDGSLLNAHAATQDRLIRARRLHEAYELDCGTALSVAAVSKADHEASIRTAQSRPKLPTQYSTERRHRQVSAAITSQPTCADARRRGTDITVCEDAQTQYARNIAAERRWEENPPVANTTAWRQGDAAPFRVDHSDARLHENLLDPNAAAWREGDGQSFHINRSLQVVQEGSSPSTSANAPRRHTDFVFHQHPELSGPRRIAEVRPGENAREWCVQGPGQSAVSDVMQTGFSWAEMQRRGMLQPRRSTSHASLLPPSRPGYY